jgi:hypothetical protein
MSKLKSKPKLPLRVFRREFKLGIVRRMLAGESVSALARELRSMRDDRSGRRDDRYCLASNSRSIASFCMSRMRSPS